MDEIDRRNSVDKADYKAMKYRSVLFYWLALGVVSTHFSVAYITSTTPYVNIVAYTAGSERLPYQFRALTSWILSMLIKVQPLRDLSHAQPAPFNRPEVMALTILIVPAVMLATARLQPGNWASIPVRYTVR